MERREKNLILRGDLVLPYWVSSSDPEGSVISEGVKAEVHRVRWKSEPSIPVLAPPGFHLQHPLGHIQSPLAWWEQGPGPIPPTPAVTPGWAPLPAHLLWSSTPRDPRPWISSPCSRDTLVGMGDAGQALNLLFPPSPNVCAASADLRGSRERFTSSLLIIQPEKKGQLFFPRPFQAWDNPRRDLAAPNRGLVVGNALQPLCWSRAAPPASKCQWRLWDGLSINLLPLILPFPLFANWEKLEGQTGLGRAKV